MNPLGYYANANGVWQKAKVLWSKQNGEWKASYIENPIQIFAVGSIAGSTNRDQYVASDAYLFAKPDPQYTYNYLIPSDPRVKWTFNDPDLVTSLTATPNSYGAYSIVIGLNQSLGPATLEVSVSSIAQPEFTKENWIKIGLKG